ncbi:MAG: hypothetical protein AAF352_01615, partial [Pseudomonadota bacterium]
WGLLIGCSYLSLVIVTQFLTGDLDQLHFFAHDILRTAFGFGIAVFTIIILMHSLLRDGKGQ